MSIERARTALRLFESAIEQPPDERDRWVAESCGEDAELAAEVRSLLVAHQNAGDFLEDGQTNLQTDFTADIHAFHDITPGTRFGDFVVEQQIGAGGMGLVYRAWQTSLNRPVALKVLPPNLRYSESARSRFQREVEAAARLRHANIVAVYTTGEDHGAAYFAMELIDGPTLGALIEALRINPLLEVKSCLPLPAEIESNRHSTLAAAGDITPLPAAKPNPPADLSLLDTGRGYFIGIADLIADVADALEYAHRLQVIHRDVKPSNLLLSQNGTIHLSDFGLARITHEPGLTRSGEMIGTPYYMAPEQVSTSWGDVDAKTDIYALGVTLYELLTLRPPFVGENRAQVISQITGELPQAPKSINRLVPEDLNTICLKAIEKPPALRYQNAGMMAADLRRFAEGKPILARRTGPLGQAVRWVQRRPAWTAALAGIGVLAVVALFFAYRTHVSETRWTDAQFDRLFETAQIAALEGDLSRAKTAIDEAEQLGAPAEQVLLLRGQLALQSGQFQEACDTLELTVQKMPDSVAAFALLSNAYDGNEQHEKRVEISNRLATLTPVTLQDYLLLGQAQSYEDFPTALATLDEAIHLDKTSVAARLVRGSVLVRWAMETPRAKLAEEAIDDLQIASELLEPNVHLLGRMLEARLVAATAFGNAADAEQREIQLEKAAAIVERLKDFPDQYQSHRWRAFYYDYVGEDERAVEAWRAMKEWRIAYLVLALFRLGEFDEALQLCDERMARYPQARFTQFFRSILLSATTDDPRQVLAAFAPNGEETLDPINANRFTYIVYCVAGNLEKARESSCAFRPPRPHTTGQNRWWPYMLNYTCGEISDDRFLEVSADAQTALCEAHFFVGVTQLARGDRAAARSHFQASADLKIVGYLEDHMSRALLAQLDRDPQWPRWIPDGR